MKKKVLLVMVGVVVAFTLNLYASNFDYSGFQDISGLNLVGTSLQISNYIQITPSIPQQNGAVWHQNLHGIDGGFSTDFEFRYNNMGGILDTNGNIGTDGISFFIQTTSNNILDIVPLDTQNNPRFQVVFDAYDNGAENISSSTVQIRLNEIEIVEVNVESFGVLFRDENVHQVSINYSGSTFKVFLDNFEVISNLNVDLNYLGLSRSYVGFQCYGGGAYSDQELLSWSFESIPEPCTMLLIGLGGLLVSRRK